MNDIAMEELLRDSVLLNPDFWEDEEPGGTAITANEEKATAEENPLFGMPMPMPMDMPMPMETPIRKDKHESTPPEESVREKSLEKGRDRKRDKPKPKPKEKGNQRAPAPLTSGLKKSRVKNTETGIALPGGALRHLTVTAARAPTPKKSVYHTNIEIKMEKVENPWTMQFSKKLPMKSRDLTIRRYD